MYMHETIHVKDNLSGQQQMRTICSATATRNILRPSSFTDRRDGGTQRSHSQNVQRPKRVAWCSSSGRAKASRVGPGDPLST